MDRCLPGMAKEGKARSMLGANDCSGSLFWGRRLAWCFLRYLGETGDEADDEAGDCINHVHEIKCQHVLCVGGGAGVCF